MRDDRGRQQQLVRQPGGIAPYYQPPQGNYAEQPQGPYSGQAQPGPHYANPHPHQVGVHGAPLETNLLLEFAAPLLMLITQIRHTMDQQDVGRLQAQIVEEIKRFSQKVTGADYSQNTIVASRYCLCTALDEAVLSRQWGANSVWVQQSLLSTFHNETQGGERFYILIDNMARDPKRNIDFLEFSYFLLSLGFQGKFYGDHMPIREEIRNRIFYQIRNTRSKPEKTLSALWQADHSFEQKEQKRGKLKRLVYLGLGVVIVLGAYFNYQVYVSAKPVMKNLEQIATVPAVTAFSQVINRPLVERYK